MDAIWMKNNKSACSLINLIILISLIYLICLIGSINLDRTDRPVAFDCYKESNAKVKMPQDGNFCFKGELDWNLIRFLMKKYEFRSSRFLWFVKFCRYCSFARVKNFLFKDTKVAKKVSFVLTVNLNFGHRQMFSWEKITSLLLLLRFHLPMW